MQLCHVKFKFGNKQTASNSQIMNINIAGWLTVLGFECSKPVKKRLPTYEYVKGSELEKWEDKALQVSRSVFPACALRPNVLWYIYFNRLKAHMPWCRVVLHDRKLFALWLPLYGDCMSLAEVFKWFKWHWAAPAWPHQKATGWMEKENILQWPMNTMGSQEQHPRVTRLLGACVHLHSFGKINFMCTVQSFSEGWMREWRVKM